MNTVTFWLAKAVAKLNKKNASQSMEDDHLKSTVKPSEKLNQLNQSLIILNAENRIGHLT